MMNILPFIDENSLKTIELLNLSHPEFMVVTEQFRFEVDQISQTNQWKSAGQLISKHLTIKTPIQEMHILHFADLEILVGTLSSEDVAYLKTNLHKSSLFQKFKISFRESTIDGSLHMLIGQPYRIVSDSKKKEEYAEIFEKPKKHRSRRQIVKNSNWPDGIVYFEYDSELSPKFKYLFKKAMKIISSKTCVKFEETGPESPNRALLINRGYCSSHIGKKARGGIQYVSVGDGCSQLGNVIHELLHCLGIMHSMSRYDRDKFLKINYESMDDTDRLNYDYYDSTESIQAVPFEYGSAMTYSSNSIAQPKNEQYLYTMGNRRTTFYDIYALYTAYQCSCPNKLECKNGGVPNAADCTVCFCPDGFGGKFCEDAPNFSKKVMAGAEWAELTTSFGYDGLSEWEFKDFTIFIEAPKDKTIQVILSRMDNFGCLVRCSWNGVEIKHMGDPRITNPLICCTDHSLFNSTVTSKLNPTPVILYTRGSKQEITLKYRFIDRNLADLPKTNNSFDSFEYPL